jgi:hypothetical protein
MPTTAKQLDLSALPSASRREVLDFYQFLLARSQNAKKTVVRRAKKYNFSDLCGTLSWKGDSVTAQRRVRDEW